MIVSGLALGTDICAHLTALDKGLPTVGVMATGPETVYPQRHKAIAEMMAHTPECALVTDYPPGTAPLAVHFLRRNRLIAGLSEATVLVESRIKGGGMMTARLASSYSRDVYALPGRIEDPLSQGCNELLRSRIAEPITSLDEFIKGLGLHIKTSGQKISMHETAVSRYSGKLPEEKIEQMGSILVAIRKERGITVEELAEKTGLGYARTAELTGILELDSLITIDLLQRCCINPQALSARE
jgi:DNA processing protein